MPENRFNRLPLATDVLIRLACAALLLLTTGVSTATGTVSLSGKPSDTGMQGFNLSIANPGAIHREIKDVRQRIQQLLVAVDRQIAHLNGDRIDAGNAAGSPVVTEEPFKPAETFTPTFDKSDIPPALPGTALLIAGVDNTGWSPIGYVKMLLRNITHGHGWMLLLVALAGVLVLGWLVLPSHRPREYQAGNEEMDFSVLTLDRKSGVTFTADDTVTTIDVDDEPWYSQSVMDDQDPDLTGEQDVDLITQSDVYLAYGRTMQAIQALLEEYEKPDSDRFVVATKLIHAYRKMGEDRERNASLQTFITRLNQDIDLFSGAEWDTLRQDLDRLRRDEQLKATGSTPRGVGRNGRQGDVDNPEVAYDSRKTAYS